MTDKILETRIEFVGAEPTHDSDCAQHNEPAYPNEPCNCSALAVRQVALLQAAHDYKGNGKPQDVVARAEVYLAFLRGAETKA